MTTDSTLHPPTADCARFEAQLGPWLEHDLDPDTQAFMTRHRASCAACAALASDIEGIVAEAAELPTLTPARDLWAGIEARLETPVVTLASASTSSAGAIAPRTIAPPAPRTVSVRWFAIAATVLVTVSSGITWQLARRGQDPRANPAAVVATNPSASTDAAMDRASADTASAGRVDGEATGTTQLAVGSATAVSRSTRLAGNMDGQQAEGQDASGATYEREIGALRHIVDERFAELDSVTVAELRRNLAIIDRAIVDSRRALARDPRSAMLSTQLDRALEAKLDLLRRVALL